MNNYLYLKQAVFSFGDKYTFFDANQNQVFKARGSVFRIPKRYQLFSVNNPTAPLITIRRKAFSFMPRYTVLNSDGTVFCTIRQHFKFGGSRFTITTPTNGEFSIRGSFFAHSFEVLNPQGAVVISMRKHIISWGDTYEIYFDASCITPEAAAAVILTIDCAIHSRN